VIVTQPDYRAGEDSVFDTMLCIAALTISITAGIQRKRAIGLIT